jgi:hypothetical protein
MTENLKLQIASIVPQMQGWCSVEKALAMAELITVTKPAVVVEVGVFGGRSLIPMAMALKENGFGVAYGIDPWKKEYALEGKNDPANDDWWAAQDLDKVHQHAAQAIWLRDLDENCVLIRAPSQACRFLFNDGIDIFHLDGSHSELSSCRDVNLYLPKVKVGGYVWMDDCDWPTTQAAVKLLESQCKHVSSVGSCRLYLKER